MHKTWEKANNFHYSVDNFLETSSRHGKKNLPYMQ